MQRTAFLKTVTAKLSGASNIKLGVFTCFTRNSCHRIPVTTPNASEPNTATFSSVKALNFEDHRGVFGNKSTWELLRGLSILGACSVDRLVSNSFQIMLLGEKLMGKRLFSALATPTIYRQFVGGDDVQTLQKTADGLLRNGLKVMVLLLQEEDIGESSCSPQKYDNNLREILSIAEVVEQLDTVQPNMQCKVTALMPADITVKLSRRLQQGVPLVPLVGQVAEAMSGGPPVCIASFSKEENIQLNEGIERHAALGKAVESRQLRLLLDAEYTSMNPAISLMALAMMCIFNTTRAVVWNTYQCYLKSAFDNISTDVDIIRHQMGLYFGAKIVRGAYMMQERKLAQEAGYPDPINDTYEDTGEMYDRVVDKMLLHISREGPKCNIMMATHNETGVSHAVNRSRALGLDPQSGEVVFGQIYGMAEQISITLAKAGYIVYKSVPYGPLSEALPYLSRRAADNRAVLQGTKKERQLLRKELMARLALSA